MTREAKIGMLTGLGVIVLIGVLLSEYLGDPKDILAGSPAGGAPANNSPTGRMAQLPIGNDYRMHQTQPISVPGMGAAGAGGQALNGGNEPSAPFPTNNASVPAAYAVEAPAPERDATGPVISPPIGPIAVGPSPTDERVAVAPDIFRLQDPKPVVDQKIAAAPPTSTTYVIVAGDNLAKIAKKFYNSSKQSDVQRIVTANPTILKDATTTLISGKKLTIPNLPTPPAATAPPKPTGPVKATDPARKPDEVMVYLPGPLDSDKTAPASPTAKSDAPKSGPGPTIPAKTNAKTYVVQSGDTLEKIAKRIAPANPTPMIDKLITTNAIKDVHSLQVGQVLKLPV